MMKATTRTRLCRKSELFFLFFTNKKFRHTRLRLEFTAEPSTGRDFHRSRAMRITIKVDSELYPTKACDEAKLERWIQTSLRRWQ